MFGKCSEAVRLSLVKYRQTFVTSESLTCTVFGGDKSVRKMFGSCSAFLSKMSPNFRNIGKFKRSFRIVVKVKAANKFEG